MMAGVGSDSTELSFTLASASSIVSWLPHSRPPFGRSRSRQAAASRKHMRKSCLYTYVGKWGRGRGVRSKIERQMLRCGNGACTGADWLGLQRQRDNGVGKFMRRRDAYLLDVSFI